MYTKIKIQILYFFIVKVKKFNFVTKKKAPRVFYQQNSA